jgi:hypothetical protein
MTLTEEIELAMAKAFFASAWADQVEDTDDPNAPNLSGQEIMDVMPDEIDPAATHAATTLRMDMERVNNLPMQNIYERVRMIRDRRQGDRPMTPAMFGHYCAMQAMGHGVGLGDAFGEDVYEAIKVPYVEFGMGSLEKDYFKPRRE